MLVLTLGPQLFLFLGKVFLLTSPWVAFKAEYRKLLPIVGGTLVTSFFVASIGLALVVVRRATRLRERERDRLLPADAGRGASSPQPDDRAT